MISKRSSPSATGYASGTGIQNGEKSGYEGEFFAATKTLIETFKKAINALTVRDTIKLRHTRPFVAKDQGYLVPKKSVFNRIIGDSQLELRFASFLEDCSDVVSYVEEESFEKYKPT